ncbi:CNT family concentrative nucleoside transporter [Elusimicrobium posterum]|uniref:NupC/NupG family nucleoside CNT transporter n=1 Tax=Elusimicrobium posterum TaxID=3116653 RepID=UPI003C73E0B8
MQIIIPLIGIIVLMGIAFAISKNRKAINWKTIGWAAALQIIFAVLILKTTAGKLFFEFMNDIILAVLDFQKAGAVMVFGDLADSGKFGYIFAFQVIPTIVFFSALMGLLYYLGIMQKVVRVFSWLMEKTCKTSGAESLSAAANIFVGQTEAPLLIKPYVEKMTKSELMCVMTGGMATVAGGVMAAYIIMLRDTIPGIAGHLMAASMMGAPAAIMFAKLIIPETEIPETRGSAKIEYEDPSANVLDAISNGTTTGLQLALNVAAMLIAFVALLALFNGGLSWITGFFINIKANISNVGTCVSGGGCAMVTTGGLTFEQIFGWILSPLAFLMGVPWSEAGMAGRLMAEKTILNEFVAYANFAELLNNGAQMSVKTKVILSYALCGFANIGSIGIQIGGIGAIAPNRRAELSKLGVYALIAGLMAACFRAIVAGLLVG